MITYPTITVATIPFLIIWLLSIVGAVTTFDFIGRAAARILRCKRESK